MSKIKTKFIEDGAVTTAKILDANVTDAKLASDSVTTSKIVNLNVTSAKLAADSVTTAKILDANVTDSKLASTFIKASGSVAFSGNQSMGGFKITSLGTPTASTDAATKAYVDVVAGSQFTQETPSGTINGSNAAFTLANTPVDPDSVMLFLNGLYLEPTTDYSISGTAITMVAAPVAGQKLRATYLKG